MSSTAITHHCPLSLSPHHHQRHSLPISHTGPLLPPSLLAVSDHTCFDYPLAVLCFPEHAHSSWPYLTHHLLLRPQLPLLHKPGFQWYNHTPCSLCACLCQHTRRLPVLHSQTPDHHICCTSCSLEHWQCAHDHWDHINIPPDRTSTHCPLECPLHTAAAVAAAARLHCSSAHLGTESDGNLVPMQPHHLHTALPLDRPNCD
mmetsp:Transcript_13372/g.36264  ORF Transcript_13372/g.36264 Transcript_13372/m.36264 type:complete len:202 (+) Transcript_13372:224-829(+)